MKNKDEKFDADFPSWMAMRVANKDDLYYDAMDLLKKGSSVSLLKAVVLLRKALEIDVDYVQTYIGFISVYENIEDYKKAEEYILIAFEKVKKQFPVWPKKMLWGELGNRAYLRAIQYRADLHWEENEKKEAEKFYKLLLKLNPSDNQGVRYMLAGLRAGKRPSDIEAMFQEGNQTQNWSKLDNMVKKYNISAKS